MIQHTSIRQPNTSIGLVRTGQADGPDEWGQWAGTKHYSLEIVQHPSRARMCGFGDKDRRPLAPAAVAKLIVRREDNSLVDVDDVDTSFFLVTVDLWSFDGKSEMNLVQHPSSADRYIPSTVPGKQRKREKSAAQGPPTPVIPSYSNPGYPFPPPASVESPSYTANFPPPTWGYPPPILPSIQTFRRTPSSGTDAQNEAWQQDSGSSDWNPDPSSFSPDRNNNSYKGASSEPSSRPSPERRESWSQNNEGFQAGQQQSPSSPSQVESSSPIYAPQSTPYSQTPSTVTAFYQPSYTQSVSTTSTTSSMSLPRHTFTRTLVGPLSANATRLLDEHRKPGIFFLFQDLSVRTEGMFRLRLRLMNVGAPPAPEAGATHVHTSISPVLAQVFTEPFTVYSAKRFPGVPDTTALSIAFGNQGQKLPLRNRHGSGKRRRQDDSGSDDESDGD